MEAQDEELTRPAHTDDKLYSGKVQHHLADTVSLFCLIALLEAGVDVKIPLVGARG